MSILDNAKPKGSIGVRTSHGSIAADDLLNSFQPGQSHVLLTLADPSELTQKNQPKPAIKFTLDEDGKTIIEPNSNSRFLPPGSQILVSKEQLESLMESHRRICSDNEPESTAETDNLQ